MHIFSVLRRRADNAIMSSSDGKVIDSMSKKERLVYLDTLIRYFHQRNMSIKRIAKQMGIKVSRVKRVTMERGKQWEASGY